MMVCVFIGVKKYTICDVTNILSFKNILECKINNFMDMIFQIEFLLIISNQISFINIISIQSQMI